MLAAAVANGGNGEGEVGKVLTGRLGHEVYVEPTNVTLQSYACATAHPSGFRFAFSLTNHQSGKAMFAAIMSAQAQGKRVFFQGTGACTIDPTVEDLAYVIVLP
jgi:hypothetical protein